MDKAVEASRGFFAKLGIALPGEVPRARRFSSGGKPGGTIALVYGDEADVLVEERSGCVESYDNLRRLEQRRTGELPRGPLRLSNPLSAQTFAFGVMKNMGLPKDCKLAELKCLNFAGGPQTPGGGYPEIDTVFQPTPFGYRIDDNFGRRDLDLDALDGTVIVYEDRGALYNSTYTIESHTCTIKLREAWAKAEPLVKKYKIGEAPFGAPAGEPQFGARPTQLMFVHPNGLMGGLKYDRSEKPARLRLAWVFSYSLIEEVWIDAADGKVLGGYCRAQEALLK